MLNENIIVDHFYLPTQKHALSPASDREQHLNLHIQAFTCPEDVIREWKELEQFAQDSFSRPSWALAWYEAHKNDINCSPVIILGLDANRKPAFLLPLFRRRFGLFNILVRPGMKHSAYFGCLFTPEWREKIRAENGAEFWSSVFSAIPGIDAVLIDGLSAAEAEHDNPLNLLPLLRSRSPAFRMPIKENWPQQYNSMIKSKVRSNDRRCLKRLAELGTLKYHVAANKQEKREFLSTLFAQKSEQFDVIGISDPYEKSEIQAFYRNLVEIDEGQKSPSTFISALMLNGEPVAINLGLIQGDQLHGLVMSMKTGSLKRFAPGRQLLIQTNQYLSDNGISAHDFGTGELSYKDDWCEEVIERNHVLAPLNFKGIFLVNMIRLASKAKGKIKRFSLIKKLFQKF
ncbi:MAG: GNAT family N-acetyltransferase [Rhizobiaceae bacterium]